ncbi:MAG: glycosyltransferase family 4 protein [Bacteroidia bacterium]|nr:glycosyltransferase family 4 protein [Bacteroidia bacterium]
MLRVPYPPDDGGAAVMLATLKALRVAGHRVVVAALNTDKHYCPADRLATLAPIRTVDVKTPIRPLAAWFNLIFSRLPYNVSRFLSEEFSRLLIDTLKTQTFDAVLFEGTYTALYAPAVRAQTNAPLILRAHNVENQIWRRLSRGEKNRLKKIYLWHLTRRIERFERENLTLFDGLVAISSTDESEFLRMGFRGETTVVPATVDLRRFSPQTPKVGCRSVGFLGSLDWKPNVEGLLWFVDEIWPRVRERMPEAQFHVAGRNPSKDLAARLNRPGVVFYGRVEDAAEFLDRFNVTVVPLLSGGGMRVKIVEQMALGKAVISTRVGAEGVEARDGVEICLADEPHSFAERIRELIADEQRTQTIGAAAARLAAELYDERTLAPRLETFLNRLIERRSSIQ